MPKFLETIFFFLFIWIYHSTTGETDSFSNIINNPSDLVYFNKYGHCSLSMGRLYDAYDVEGHLIESILNGYEYLGLDKRDKMVAKDFEEHDEIIKKELNSSLITREKENSTFTPINHPVNVLHFLRRIVFHFNPIFNKIFTDSLSINRNFYKDLSGLVDKSIREKCSCWPTASDLKFAISGLARIVKVYNISKTELMKGIIMGNESIEPLQIDEIIVLTQEANRNYYYRDVLEWTEILLNELKSFLNNDQTKNIIRMRASATFHIGNKNEAIAYLEEIIRGNQFETHLLKRDLSYYKSKLEKDDSTSDQKDDVKDEHLDELCRESRNTSERSILRCFYRRVKNGWDRAKVEIMNANPPIYKYYNVISDSERDKLLQLVKSTQLKLHLYKQKGEVKKNDKYSKEETIFWDDDFDITKKLSRRISYFTGLETNNHKYNTKLSSSGPFQIINYGIGGFEESQVDYLATGAEESKAKKSISVFGGDRLATWIYQLTDKIEGGRIIFPKVNISIFMEQGTGLMWFNLMKNGTTNPLSEHMECPVISGSKWIGKKFLHENGNMFARKCNKNYRSFF